MLAYQVWFKGFGAIPLFDLRRLVVFLQFSLSRARAKKM